MLAVFWCRNRNIFCFVRIGLVLSKKSRSADDKNKSAVFNIIYQALNSREILGDS